MSIPAFLNDEELGPEKSIDEFIALINLSENQDITYELIGGQAVMMSGNASGNHQRICAYILSEIHHYLRGKQCEVFHDLNVYLFKDNIENCKNVFQPDILVICDRNKVTEKGCEGAPDFVVEVISKSTARNDYFIKYKYYMEYGVKEYWIVDLAANQITVYLNSEEGTPVIYKYVFSDKIKVNIFESLSIDFEELLETLDKSKM